MVSRGIADTGGGTPILITLKDVANETVTGDDTENRLVGGAGDDVLTGGRNNDSFVVDSLKDLVSEPFGGGIDTIEASLSYDLAGQARAKWLLGTVENLTLLETKAAVGGFGNALANTLRGNGNANILDGNNKPVVDHTDFFVV